MKLTRKICPSCNANCSEQDAVCWLCFSRFPEKAPASSADPRSPSGQAEGEANDQRVGAEQVAVASVSQEAAAAVTNLPSRSSGGSFGLMSLMMIMTLIAVCMGAFTVAPGLGILISVLATPALIRTVVVSMRQREQGIAPSPGDKFMLFVASLGALITAGMVAIAVFFGTCVAFCFGAMAMDGNGFFTGGGSEAFIWVFIIVGAAAGIASGIFILMRFWRKR